MISDTFAVPVLQKLKPAAKHVTQVIRPTNAITKLNPKSIIVHQPPQPPITPIQSIRTLKPSEVNIFKPTEVKINPTEVQVPSSLAGRLGKAIGPNAFTRSGIKASESVFPKGFKFKFEPKPKVPGAVKSEAEFLTKQETLQIKNLINQLKENPKIFGELFKLPQSSNSIIFRKIVYTVPFLYLIAAGCGLIDGESFLSKSAEGVHDDTQSFGEFAMMGLIVYSHKVFWIIRFIEAARMTRGLRNARETYAKEIAIAQEILEGVLPAVLYDWFRSFVVEDNPDIIRFEKEASPTGTENDDGTAAGPETGDGTATGTETGDGTAAGIGNNTGIGAKILSTVDSCFKQAASGIVGTGAAGTAGTVGDRK